MARWRRSRSSDRAKPRSEEHTSELQSLRHLVCRLLLEKKKKNRTRDRNSEAARGHGQLQRDRRARENGQRETRAAAIPTYHDSTQIPETSLSDEDAMR